MTIRHNVMVKFAPKICNPWFTKPSELPIELRGWAYIVAKKKTTSVSVELKPRAKCTYCK